MKTKRKYAKPKVESRKITLGVYGNYGRGENATPTGASHGPPSIVPHQDP